MNDKQEIAEVTQLAEQIISKKGYGDDKFEFRPDETAKILNLKSERSLERYDHSLRPIEKSDRRKVYLRPRIVDHIVRRNT